jgi:hypothetical protein
MMFCVKGFAAGVDAAPFSGYAAVAIGASVIAAITAAARLVAPNVERQTSVTGRLSKEDLIRGIAREPIERGSLQFPLWIKVPLKSCLLARFSRRQ